MALRLGDLVVCGELFNTRKNCVHGYLRLQGIRWPLMFELTGNCADDLAGRHIRFAVRGRRGPDEEPPAESASKNEHGRGRGSADEGDCDHDRESAKALLARLNLPALAWMQIGPTGTMTAARKVRVADCPADELYARCKLGAPPPTTWKRCLYLEWFGQHGRVVIELLDPVIEVVEPERSPGVGERVTPLDLPADDDAPGPAEAGPGITAIELDPDGQAVISHDPPHLDAGEDSFAEMEGEPDSYGLIPGDLQRQLDEQARATDRALHEDAAGDDVIRQMELMDDLIERGEGEPVGTLFDDVVHLRPPDQLDEPAAEQELKALLARLALHGVALHVCEHFTAAAAYRLLVERICREEKAYSELRGTQWVQHFATSDFCPQCEAESEQG